MIKQVQEAIASLKNSARVLYGHDVKMEITLDHKSFDLLVIESLDNGNGSYSFHPSGCSDFKILGVRIKARHIEE